MGEAVLTCAHNVCFEQKYKKDFFLFLKKKKDFFFFISEKKKKKKKKKKILNIACASFRNDFRANKQKTTSHVQQGLLSFKPPRGKTNNVVSEQVGHKPACT